MPARATPGVGWPSPQPGDVLRYAYLWAREAAAGQEEGLKDRPAVVVLAAMQSSGSLRVIVAPVTHSAPEHDGEAVELPANIKRDLGLDRARSWIVTSEVNSFAWPGPDVRLVGDDPYHGAIPDWLFERVREGLAQRAGAGRVAVTRRTE